jgi:hypothetical protein
LFPLFATGINNPAVLVAKFAAGFFDTRDTVPLIQFQELCRNMNIFLDLKNPISAVVSSNFVILLGENFFFRTNFLRSPHNFFRRTTKSLSVFNMLTPILHTETLRVRQGMLLAISHRKNEFLYLNIDVKQVQN